MDSSDDEEENTDPAEPRMSEKELAKQRKLAERKRKESEKQEKKRRKEAERKEAKQRKEAEKKRVSKRHVTHLHISRYVSRLIGQAAKRVRKAPGAAAARQVCTAGNRGRVSGPICATWLGLGDRQYASRFRRRQRE